MAYDIIVGRGEDDKKKLGKKGLIRIGKGYVKMGQYNSLSNNIFLDVSRSHVILIAGKRGSGKSYTLGVMTEEISNLPTDVSQNIASLIFDTMGIYWTMKYPNEKDKELLHDWDLKAKKLPVKIFVPFAYYDKFIESGIPADEKFALDVSELTAEDWLITFKLDLINPVAVLIERIISQLKKEGEYYTIANIIPLLENDKKTTAETINAAVGLFESANTWGVFAKENIPPTKIKDLITPVE